MIGDRHPEWNLSFLLIKKEIQWYLRKKEIRMS